MGAERAVSEALDELLVRMHGILSGGTYPAEFIAWLAERGYRVAPLAIEDCACQTTEKATHPRGDEAFCVGGES